MSFFTLGNLCDASGGEWNRTPEDAVVIASGVSTDTRTIEAGNLFCAILGDRFDGHDHIPEAIDRGASCVLLSRPLDTGRVPSILVDDTRLALGRLAQAYRASLARATVFAITGSNGKTTTVRILSSVLSQAGTVHASPKSFNNDIGVPLTILSTPPETQFLICEVGTNAPGEIAPLAEIISPDVAVITSIGSAHLEALGSREGVAIEKAAILGPVTGRGLAVLPHDEPLLADARKRVQRLITFGKSAHASACVRRARHIIEDDRAELEFDINDRTDLRLPLIGLHNAGNAAIAIAIADHLGMTDDQICKGLRSVEAPEDRLSVRTTRGVTVVNDAYNANPDSMLAALRTFSELSADASRRVLIIGQMGELGEHTQSAHAELAERIATVCSPDLLVTIGPAARETHKGCQGLLPRTECRHFDTLTDELARRIAGDFVPGDAVLLKGSRVNALERIARAHTDVTDDASSCSTA